MPLADGQVFAGYTILRLLGSGGMGEVYLAQHPRLPRRDALKVLPAAVTADSEFRERFNREADLAATLWHPHIVGVHDRGEFDGQIWISMDYVDGTDAAQLLRDRYPNGLPEHDVLEIVTAVAGALDYAHQHDLLHRDVKPANILLANPESGERRILLADFGIARRIDEISGLTATNMTVGTVSYAAPEQLMGSPIDGRADQYALAATAFHLLTGSPPFPHSNPAVVISQHLSAPPPMVGAHRPELSRCDPVLARALAKDPGARFERCLTFAQALSQQLGAAPPGDLDVGVGPTRAAAAAVEPAQQAQPSPPRSLLRAGVVVPAVLAVMLIGAIAVAVAEFRRNNDSSPTASTSSPAASPATAAPMAPTTTPGPPSTTANPSPTAPPATPVAAVAVIGAYCSPPGGTGETADGSVAYCAQLQTSGAYVWSLTQGVIPSPSVTDPPTENPFPAVDESPVRVCMEQTGATRFQCRESIRRSNEAGNFPVP